MPLKVQIPGSSFKDEHLNPFRKDWGRQNFNLGVHYFFRYSSKSQNPYVRTLFFRPHAHTGTSTEVSTYPDWMCHLKISKHFTKVEKITCPKATVDQSKQATCGKGNSDKARIRTHFAWHPDLCFCTMPSLKMELSEDASCI
ncbi:unnamed protein product [Natator depressus]